MKNYLNRTILLVSSFVIIYSCSYQKDKDIEMKDVYPWCIVAFDSLSRSPNERIIMLKELGFVKYAYDWRDSDLKEMESEFKLAKENDIEIISVWLWLNAERDSVGKLSSSNEGMFEILKDLHIKTTLWLSFSNNFFEGLTHEQSIHRAFEMIKFVNIKAEEIDCKIALYNHRGWFGDPKNQIEIIEALPQLNLSMVYNFHHAHQYLDEFPTIVKKIKPYLSSVNLNGMRKEGPQILPIGTGDYEKDMIKLLINEGYKGPWGLLGHVENEDVKIVLKKNIDGFNALKYKFLHN